jgi:uncharacterized protein YukE
MASGGNFLGNDPEQMDRLATRMEQEAGKIDEAIRLVTTDLQSLQWTGADRTRFESDWNSNHASALKRAVESLRQNAQVVKKEAAAQRQVSGA